MMGGPSPLAGVVTPDSTLLGSVARHHRGVQIERQPIHSDLRKEPAIEDTEYVIAGRLRELAEEPHYRFETRHAGKPNRRFKTGS